MNEWQFTSDVAKWITSILSGNRDLPFSEAYCEGQSPNSLKRRDLTIKDLNGRIVLTGEVKLPGKKDGATPYNSSVVEDARVKARAAEAPFFFTWNVNECVLWKTEDEPTHPRPDYKRWSVANIRDAKALESPAAKTKIKKWLVDFLRDAAEALRGASVIERKSPDEKFIDALEAALRTPVALTFDALEERYRKQSTRRELDEWMRGELGFIIVVDPEGIRDNLDRTAKHACYALANKLVFYEALLKRYGALLNPLDVPDHINTAERLRTHFEGFFARARQATHDYETVFGEDALGLVSRVPFYNDGVVDFWRAFVEEIHEFDFSRLDYEVVGSIFERLISPEERRKYGQFYTRVEIVDLINSFAIRSGEETVMDPACGGGTFLVRAYARKRELAPQTSHAQRIRDLYGIDVSRFATHLTTINLATRDLIDEENYPQVARSDFFDVRRHGTLMKLPRNVTTGGLGRTQRRDVQISPLDAIVGNPPYIRQEGIPGPLKARYQEIAQREKASLSKQSDIHCYFWPHSLSFLKENGYLCFLTSSGWLDTNYGFKLQDWILQHFEIIAVLESREEPWFVGARVATTATILRRQVDAKKRMNNLVRFVQLRKPMSEILAHDGTTAGAVSAANRFRDELLNLDENFIDARYRARLVRQGDLWMEGVRLGVAMGKSEPVDVEDCDPQPGKYYAGKWGVHLRAPDLWFDLSVRFEDRLVPLGLVAEEVSRGVTTGKDSFFYPRNATVEALERITDPAAFRTQFGAEREEVVRGKVQIVRCGEGYEEMRPIESSFLEPVIHGPMDVSGFKVAAEDCDYSIVQIPSDRDALNGSYALRYVEWGEEQGYHEGATCKARVTQKREWYDLTGRRRSPALWVKERQYRHFAPANSDRLIANCRLYDVYPPHDLDDPDLWGGLLNSTVVLLSCYQYGRPTGNEGLWGTMVVDANIMRVPDPRVATIAQRRRVADAFRAMKDRPALGFLSERRLRRMSLTTKGKEEELVKLSEETELTQLDRRELDDAVLELLGLKSARERTAILGDLYSYLEEFFEWTRQKEEVAIQNKNNSGKGTTVRPTDLADEIRVAIEHEHGTLLRSYDDFLDPSHPFDTYEIPSNGIPEPMDGLFDNHAIRFFTNKKTEAPIIETRNDAQRNLLLFLVKSSMRGFVRVPLEAEASQALHKRYSQFVNQRAETLRTLVEERTADPDLQDKVYAHLLRRL